MDAYAFAPVEAILMAMPHAAQPQSREEARGSAPAGPLGQLLQRFMENLGTGEPGVYNEFSLQFELAYLLRTSSPYRIEFERPVSTFGLSRGGFIKKEIDLVVQSGGLLERHAIELKYPRNGQVPEQMFKACQDIRFLEQLRGAGFSECYFILLTEDPLFWSGPDGEGIYRHFRGSLPQPIHGRIPKPTGNVGACPPVEITGDYRVQWRSSQGNRRFCIVEV